MALFKNCLRLLAFKMDGCGCFFLLWIGLAGVRIAGKFFGEGLILSAVQYDCRDFFS